MEGVKRALKRGTNRLFVVMAILWFLTCTVAAPLYFQLRGISEANSEYKVEICADAPYPSLKECVDEQEHLRQLAIEQYQFPKFWLVDVAFWWIILPLIFIPLAILYAGLRTYLWVRDGFRDTSAPDSN
jgi:hypothetical protein